MYDPWLLAALEIIEEKIKEYHYTSNDPNHRYAEILYPQKALSILLLSRSDHWPGYDIDRVLDGYLGNWFRAKRLDQTQYVNDLYAAILQRKCQNGVYARLNLILTSAVMPDRIVGATRGQKIKLQKLIIPNAARRDIKLWLQRQNALQTDIRIIQRELSDISKIYDLEQALLSWMGYLVLKSMATGGYLIPPLPALPDKRELRSNHR